MYSLHCPTVHSPPPLIREATCVLHTLPYIYIYISVLQLLGLLWYASGNHTNGLIFTRFSFLQLYVIIADIILHYSRRLYCLSAANERRWKLERNRYISPCPTRPHAWSSVKALDQETYVIIITSHDPSPTRLLNESSVEYFSELREPSMALCFISKIKVLHHHKILNT